MTFEYLENRQLLSSFGIDTNVFPKIKANDSYSYSGPPSVSASPFVFQMSATAFTFQSSAATAPVAITSGLATVDIKVDSSGNLIGGNGSPFDLIISGTITGVATQSPLLEGNILQFASQYNGVNPSEFDFRFVPTGGSLTTGGSPAFPLGMDIGVVMTSDKGNTFTGDFGVAFGGNAKVTAVPIAALPVALYGYKFDDVNDNGIDNAEPRLANWTIQLTGTDDFGNPVNLSTLTDANGQYSFTGLNPGTYTVTEVQQTGWTQTAGGTTVTLTSGQVAVAVSGEAGMLPPGETEVVTTPLAFGNFKPTSIVIGMDKSPATPKTVDVFDPLTGNSRLSAPIVPYGNTFEGGARVATGDLNGNGFDDIVTAPGRGASPPVINVYDQFGTLLTSFAAYPASVNGGLQVAVADLNGDGLDDIITVPSWGPAEVRVFYNMGVIGGAPVFSTTPDIDFLAFPSSFVGGAVVAASSEGTMSNGVPQIVVGSGAGMAATVEVFNASSVGSTSPPALATPTATFMPFNTITPPLQGGVSLAMAQLTSAPNQSIVVGAGMGGQSLVNIWGWNSSSSSYLPLSANGVAGFPAFPGTSANAPVQVATLNDPFGVASAIVAVQGAGGTATNVHQLNITSVSPLVLSSPIVSPVPFSGPSTIAVINNVQPGVVPHLVANPAVKTATAAVTTVAKPAATTPTATTTTTATAAATAKPATTPTAATVVTTAKPVTTTTTTTTTAAATAKPATTPTAATVVTTAKPVTTTTTTTTTAAATAKPATTPTATTVVTTAKPVTTTTTTTTTATATAKPATTPTAATVVTKAKPVTTTTTTTTTAAATAKPATTPTATNDVKTAKPVTATTTTTTTAEATAKPAATPSATTVVTTAKPVTTTTTTPTTAAATTKPATTTTATAATTAKPATTTTAATSAAIVTTSTKPTTATTTAASALLAAYVAAAGKK